MSASQSQDDGAVGVRPDAIRMEEASLWLARRDRGLSPQEQDAYLQWLQADACNAAALNRCAATLQRMMRLYEWQPAHTAEPNPDLFAPVAKKRGWWRAVALAAAASIALTLGVWSWRGAPGADNAPEKSYLVVNELMALPDGSRAELKDESRVLVQYSAWERRVRLTSGEAHFTVWKDAARPFVVEVGGVSVVAVGTSFSVRWEDRDVEVLVTSGTVRVEGAPVNAERATAVPQPEVSAGQRIVVSHAMDGDAAALASAIEHVTPAEMARSLAWLTPRLQFHETPLQEAIEQFNALNRHQIVLGDSALAGLSVGGTFRPDNVDAFVRLLEVTFRIRAEKRSDYETVLRKGS